jgi:hypothetical protein
MVEIRTTPPGGRGDGPVRRAIKTLINDGSLVVRETLEGVVLLSPGTAILDDLGLRETATGGAAAAAIRMKALADGE